MQTASRITKLLGTSLFTANMDMTTEFGEIRVSVFTSTKSHEAFEPTFAAVRNSAIRNGQPEPEVAYTDNITDAPMLTRLFPTLLKDVVPAGPWRHLPVLEVPPSVRIHVVQQSEAITEVIRTFLPHPDGPELSPSFIREVAVDTEWNVNLEQCGPVQRGSSGKTAIVTLATETDVYILQVAQFVAAGKLPSLLPAFLSSTRIHKIGRGIKNDLKRLAGEVSLPAPFGGAIDIGNMALQRGLVGNQQVSLAELSARVLHHRMNKDNDIRISTAWEYSQLPEQHVQYAALDAWATFLIYKKLQSIPIPGKLSANSPAGTEVALWTDDHRCVAAYGELVDKSVRGTGNVQLVRDTQTIITVTKVLVPGALMVLHKRASLESFGPPRFQIACLWKHLQLREGCPEGYLPLTEGGVKPAGLNDAQLEYYKQLEEDFPGSNPLHLGEEMEKQDMPFQEQEIEPFATEVSELGLDIDIDAEQASWVFAKGIEPPNSEDEVYSRVLKDVWHLMHMIPLPANHGLRHEFSTKFRDILLVPDAEDRTRIEAFASKSGKPHIKLCSYMVLIMTQI